MKSATTWMKYGTLAIALALVSACAQQPAKTAGYCQLSPTNNVDRLFAEASGKLEDSSCQYFFPEYREQRKTRPVLQNCYDKVLMQALFQSVRGRSCSASTLIRSFTA